MNALSNPKFGAKPSGRTETERLVDVASNRYEAGFRAAIGAARRLAAEWVSLSSVERSLVRTLLDQTERLINLATAQAQRDTDAAVPE